MIDKEKLVQFIPPFVLNLYKRRTNGGFFGNFPTWEAARDASSGYDSDLILNKVKEAMLKIRDGTAIYERDSVLFDRIQYSWPLLTGLLWIASRCYNKLNLVDFGGSLGSSYYQNKIFLQHLSELNWSIVEQNNFVECGKNYFENNNLRFYHDLNECIRERHPNTVLFSSVIQYLEKPYDLLADVISKGFGYIIFDRTSFMEAGNDRITVQKVPSSIYPASYPAWFFNKHKFYDFFADDYELIAEFDALAGTIDLGNTVAHDKGFIFKKKSSAKGDSLQ
jgi:putative methyltransferase (TIGR04325 family)